MNQMKTLFVVSLLLLSACIPCVAAAGNNERPHAPDMQPDKNIGQAPGADARAGPGGIGGTAAQVKIARERYLRERTDENLETLKDIEKKHFEQLIDTMISRLEILQERIAAAEDDNTMVPEDASENLEQYITSLESYKSEVDAADTPDEIRAVARSINEEWQSVRKEMLHYTKFMVADGIHRYIEKANNITDRLDEEIIDIGKDGFDTANMDRNLDEFKEKLECVEENYKLAEDAVSDEAIDARAVQQYIKNATLCIREANSCLGEIFREMRALDGYDEDVSESEDDESADDDSAEVDETAVEDDEDASTSDNETETDDDDSANETATNDTTINDTVVDDDDEDAGTSGNETESETDDGDSANETATNETTNDDDDGDDDDDAGTSGNETDEETS